MNRSSSSYWRISRLLVCATAAMLMIAGSAFAQLQTGNIFGTVVDNQGQGLPGVTVTLTGGGAPRVFVTEADGSFRFINLSPGSYDLRAELAGFGQVTRSNVSVNVGRNTDLTLTVAPALEQTITVTAETPLLDVRRTGTGATVTEVELNEVPTARDPWAILNQVPGVMSDRLNIGGSESGQQAQFVGKGAGGDQATFNVDGVNITDMSATGSSPGYYDFDAFEEIQATTGGTDPRIMTPGVQLNMVTKRGTNELRGSARYFLTDGEWQEETELEQDEEAYPYLAAVNSIEEITDMGIELGGPIMRDRLWLWGAYSENEIYTHTAQRRISRFDRTTGEFTEVRVVAPYPDNTFLDTINAKLNAQITSNNSAVGSYWDSAKEKVGRNASPTRPPETTWNQGGYGPSGAWKVEDTHIFSPSFYVTGLYSKVNGGFFLSPRGDQECKTLECAQSLPSAVLDGDQGFIWQRSFYYAFIERPQDLYRLDSSSFFDTGAINHELKFGLGYRETTQQTVSGWPQDQFFVNYGGGFGGVYLYRQGRSNATTEYTDFYVGDTMLIGNLTLQAGLRYDNQTGSVETLSVPASTAVPDLLPAVSFTATGEELEWETISPRLGATYTIGSNRRTLVRAGYNRYVDQLGTGTIGAINPLSAYQYFYYYGVQDANGDFVISQDEIGEGYLYGAYNLDPNFAGDQPQQLFRFASDMDAPTTDELIFGVEHELMPEFTIGFNYTHRQINDTLWTQYEKTRGAGDFYTSADYEVIGNATGNLAPCPQSPSNTSPGSNPTLPQYPCTGRAFSVPVYGLREGVPAPIYGVIGNRPDYEQEYDGVELTLVKRMSNRWMARGNFSWSDWTQNVGANGFADPTTLRTTYGCSNCDGATVLQGSGTGSGAKGGVYISPGWSYNLTSVVELPFGINLGASVLGREGYAIPYVARVNTGSQVFGGEGFKQVLVTEDTDEFRHDDLFNLDLRLAKEFRFAGVGLTISGDVFNVTNERTVLQRNTRINVNRTVVNSVANQITEFQSPRIFRVGARVTF